MTNPMPLDQVIAKTRDMVSQCIDAPQSKRFFESVIHHLEDLSKWKTDEQQALISMATTLLLAGFKGDGVTDGVKWLAQQLEQAKEIAKDVMRHIEDGSDILTATDCYYQKYNSTAAVVSVIMMREKLAKLAPNPASQAPSDCQKEIAGGKTESAGSSQAS